jgi:hypothetical protein
MSNFYCLPGRAGGPPLVARERHSRVTFDIEPSADMARLTITHDELETGSETLRKISEGWPRVLSSLKSLLETGRRLQTWAGR